MILLLTMSAVLSLWPGRLRAQSGVAETHYPEHVSADAIPVFDFARGPKIISVQMSPDGQRAVAFYPVGGKIVLRLMSSLESTAQDENRLSLRPENLRRMEWIDNNSVIVEIRRDYISFAKYPPTAETVHHIQSFSIDTDEVKTVVYIPHDSPAAEAANTIVHTLPESPDEFLLSYAPDGKSYPGVYRLNVRTGESELVEPPRPPISGWFADVEGTIRFGSGIDDDGLVILVRTADEADWRVLENDALLEGGQMEPVSLSPDGTSLIVRSAQNQGRYGLYRLSLETGRVIGKVFEHPTVDVSSVTTSHLDGRLLSANFIDHRIGHRFFDERIEAKMSAVDRAFPDRSTSILQTSIDDRYLLLFLSSDVYPGAYYRLDTQTNEMMLIDEVRPDMNPAEMSPMQSETYFARDGLEINGYLTVPRGMKPKDLPVVIIPHATVADRVHVRFDYLAQFFASRGIAVFEPNYRGSAGYGFAFSALAQTGWGLEMQDDIADAAEYLLESGIGRRGRICLVGQNYGGYAVLMGIIRDPDLFACGVAISPITNLIDYTEILDSIYGEAIVEIVAGQRKKRELREASPVERVKDITRPLLIIHGTNDEQIPLQFSIELVEKLEKLGADFDSLALQGEGNAIAGTRSRALLLQKSLEFLQTNLGLSEASSGHRLE